ncbi:MAG TPA: hypothetical protein VLL48_13550 [Longimicrobiales bacterium]|nr:hypothetical protein [Longimicrobiales bacterium]
MKTKTLTLLAAALLTTGCGDSSDGVVEPERDLEPEGPAFAVGPGAKPMVLRLLGSDEMTPETVADPDDVIPGADEAVCYTVPMWDVSQDRVAGTAKDCISVLGTASGGVQVVGTTTFDFGGGHTFTTQGLTSVQATTHGSPGITHVTGAIPSPGSNGVIAGTGRFRKLRAMARLSGAVNLTDFPASATFDCLFVITPL